MSSYKSDLISGLNDLADAINLKAGSSGTKSLSALKTTVQGIQKRKPEQVGNITPDFSSGDQTVDPSTGRVFSSVTITKPATLIAGNIAKGITIAGIMGTYDNSVRTENITVELNMENGNQYIYPDEDYGALTSVIVQKPDTLIPENIVKDVDIGGVIGSFEGGALPEGAGWHYFDGSSILQGYLEFYDTEGQYLGNDPSGIFYVSAGGSEQNPCYELFSELPDPGETFNFTYDQHNYTITCVD